jgi:hypothetical protein
MCLDNVWWLTRCYLRINGSKAKSRDDTRTSNSFFALPSVIDVVAEENALKMTIFKAKVSIGHKRRCAFTWLTENYLLETSNRAAPRRCPNKSGAEHPLHMIRKQGNVSQQSLGAKLIKRTLA